MNYNKFSVNDGPKPGSASDDNKDEQARHTSSTVVNKVPGDDDDEEDDDDWDEGQYDDYEVSLDTIMA